ncbi:MAG: TIGR02266 family protein [Polyangia bacterium]
MADKRQHPRVPVSLTVSYPSKGALAQDLISDLSPGGVFIRTSQPLPIGTEIELQVVLGDEEPPIGVRGKVVWLRSGQAATQEGMGIRFTGVMGEVLAELVSAAKKD